MFINLDQLSPRECAKVINCFKKIIFYATFGRIFDAGITTANSQLKAEYKDATTPFIGSVGSLHLGLAIASVRILLQGKDIQELFLWNSAALLVNEITSTFALYFKLSNTKCSGICTCFFRRAKNPAMNSIQADIESVAEFGNV